ncbi:MAG: exo-alpha-sialidase, partial [Gemmiger sp.]
ALCMILTFVPVSALAEDAAGSSDTGAVMDSTVENEPEEQQDVAEGSAAQPQTSTFSLPSSTAAVNDAAAYSLTMGTKPADGTTTGNPFVQGTGGSNSFRIPAMVTLNDGTIVAAADARWNTTYDGGGLDTIVSYSVNNGDNWNYTFANYLGDNGNTYNGSGSTAFIDPALATNGETVYMLCDLYPYGVALNGSGNTAPSKDVGFNADGTLKLAASGSSTYDYYLKDGQIYDSGNNVVSGYTVDAYFNITGNSYDTNLFFSDSPYQVVRTGYLYLTQSTDGGKTWSEPTLIPNVKTSSEQVCLVGPGRGLVTGGKIIFPVYSYNGSAGSQQMGFIYSSDGGATWSRSANFTGASWSSEAAVVALSDGTLRFFYRNGTSRLCYVDYSWETGSWGSAVNTGIATNSNTQISAISYSKTVDGKQVILVSCPTGSNSNGSADSSASARLNGKIFVGYVNSDQTMSWQSDKAISVTSDNNQFMYSCLTELANGKVAILYENQESAWGTGDNCYYTMGFATYKLDLPSIITDVATGVSVDFGNTEVTKMTVTKKGAISALGDRPYVAYDISVPNFSGNAKVTIPLNDTSLSGENLQAVYIDYDGKIAEMIDGTYDSTAKTFTFTATHFSTYAVTPSQTVPIELTVGEAKEITDKAGNYENSDTNQNPNTAIATMKVDGTDAQKGGVKYTEASVTCKTLK